MMPSLSPLAAAPEAPAAADSIKDVGLDNFMKDVIEASTDKIVVVDFWAPWCGPCKQLGPALEKIVRSYKGAVHMAKIDIDQNPEIAQQMRVQSIPAVFAFFRGQPVDGFMGAQTEAQIKSWLDRVIKATGAGAQGGENAGLETALGQAAEFIAKGDIATAQSIYTDILDMEPMNAAAFAGLLRCIIASGEVDVAKQMLTAAPPEMAKHKALDSVRASLELAEQLPTGTSTAEFEAKLAQNPADHQARFDLAMAHYASGQKEQAVEQLLEAVRRDRNWNEQAARKQLVKLFEAFGPTDELTISARKRLSSILFS